MKYPKYVYKRIDGQEYRYPVGQAEIENMMLEKKKDSTESPVEPVKKIS